MGEYALRLNSGTDTAPRMRMGDALSLQHAGQLNTRSGLRRDGGGAVDVVAGSMTVQATPFLAWIDGGTSDAQGGYPFILDATKTLTIADGDATLPRVDTIAVVVSEDAFDGSGETAASVQVVQGVPGSGAPVLPATALALRDVNVPAGLSAGTGGLAAANLGSDRRTYTVGAGGLLPVSGATERDALPAMAGQAVWRDDTATLELYDGTSWTAIGAPDDTGWVAANLLNGWTVRDGSPAYRRVNGVVYLRGRLSGTTWGTVALVLPAGFRPSAEMFFQCPSGGGVGRVQVDTAGNVTLTDAAAGNINFQSLAGAAFPVG